MNDRHLPPYAQDQPPASPEQGHQEARRRLHAAIRGRVQGVSFRVFVQSHAQALGLTGTVRNVYFPRRLVEVVAEGDEPDLERLLDLLRTGPQMAQVDDVDVIWSAASGEFTGFRVTF